MLYRKNIADQFEVSIGHYANESHDYFLQTFVPEGPIQYIHVKLKKKEQVKGEIFFVVNEDKEAVSLPNSPFGGFWLGDSVTSDIISEMIAFILEWLKSSEVKSVSITQAPAVYGNKSDLIGYLLFSQGFRLERVLNHQVLSGKKKIKNNLNHLLPKYQKKAKEQQFNIVTGNIQSFSFLKEIAQWKNSRGHEVTVDENKLIHQVSSFPERYFVITILQAGVSVAHAVAVKLTSDSLYYFYSAINPKNQMRLTGELLMVYLLKLAMEQKVSFLDLGSSDLDGIPNHKLMYFKDKFADTWTNKSTWIKTL
ncbi:hypothetical protein ACFSKL_22875 [Belliella marina]|uniref:BioF2-like acetyltransferase domain-containing protein n=1 Tax=Belliella marina TaxID=1644146 RepID=A0ABW4VTM8_9BACT